MNPYRKGYRAGQAAVRIAARLVGALDTLRLYLLDTLYLLQNRKAQNEPTDAVVFIRLDNIGDYILWTPCLDELKRHFAGRPLHLFCNASWSELASGNVWDSVTAIDTSLFSKNYAYRKSIFEKLRKLNARTVINPTFSRVFWKDDALLRISAAPNRVGQRGDTSNTHALGKFISDRFYTDLIDVPDAAHELTRSFNFVFGVTGRRIIQALPRLHVTAGPEEASERYAVLFPGAAWSGRCWPPERFAEIGKRLNELAAYKIVVCGGPSDKAAGEIIADRIPEALNLVGRTSLAELTTILERASIVISNETSAAHIAAAVRTPVVCVTGGGHFGRFVPYPQGDGPSSLRCVHFAMPCFGCNWNCIFPTPRDAPKPCIAKIEIDQVWEAVGALLGLEPVCAA